MRYENISHLERNGLRENALPRNHLEGIAPSRLEGMSETEKNRFVGEHYFREEVETAQGTLEAFQEVAQEGTKEEFASLYERYVDAPRELEAQNPEAYAFFKARIFYGKEFHLNGMEKFMRDTAPKSVEKAAEIPAVTDTAPDSRLLPKMELLHPGITNCQKPFSHGNVMNMAGKMDFIKGDTSMLPIAPDRMVACRNLMALCGKEFTEADVTCYTVDNDMVAYDPLYLKGFNHSSNEVYLSSIIRGMSGVEIYRPTLDDTGDPAEAMADLLDRGHRGVVTYNPALLNRTDAEAATPLGKLIEKFPHSANETSTLLCAVRDGNTGKTAGFFICDSTRKEAARYVEADRLVKAMDVKYGEALFTKEAYPEK